MLTLLIILGYLLALAAVLPAADWLRRFDIVQRSPRLKLVIAGLVLVTSATAAGYVVKVSYELREQRQALFDVLQNENLVDETPIARRLKAEGTFELNGRTYGFPELRLFMPRVFNSDGTFVSLIDFIDELLADQRPPLVPGFVVEQPRTAWLLAIVVVLWLQCIVWLDLLVPLLVASLVTGLATSIGLLGVWALHIRPYEVLSFVTPGLLTFTFVMLTRLFQFIFQAPWNVCAVAHTVVKEASRLRLSMAFIVLLMLAMAIIPLQINPTSPVRYQIQSYIASSLNVTLVLCVALTLFLACATVAFEIRDRQIWQLMTKPVSPLAYLAGKWLGVMSINLSILLVAGVSVFLYIQFLRTRPVAEGVAGQLDAVAVRDQVLTARASVSPEFPSLTNDQLLARVELILERDPNQEDTPANRRVLARKLQQEYAFEQRSVEAGKERTYTFRGLGDARNLNSTLTLRYRLHVARDDEHTTQPVYFAFNEQQDTLTYQTYIPTMSHTMLIGSDMIRDDGTILVTIVNAPSPNLPVEGTLNFDADDFEILYQVATFENNFFRAIFIMWVKLAFLAMLGVSAATALSFPVACLFAFTLFMAGTLSPFMKYALEEYYPASTEIMNAGGWQNFGLVVEYLFKTVVRGVCQGLIYTFGEYGEYRPTQRLIEGRLIPWSDILKVTFKIGVFWSGVLLLLGYLTMRRRELATYSGQG